MSTVSNDHYNGFYIWETEESINNQTSIASKYRRMRKSLLDKLDSLEPKVALALIDAEYTEYDDLLKSDYPKIHEQLYNAQLFYQDHIKVIIFKEDPLLIASFLVFLAQLYKEKELIYNLTISSESKSITTETGNVNFVDDDVLPESEEKTLNHVKNSKIYKTLNKNILSSTEIGLLFRILIKNGFINEASGRTYGVIGEFMMNINSDNIRKAMTETEYSILIKEFKNKPSKHHLEQIKSAIMQLNGIIDELIEK